MFCGKCGKEISPNDKFCPGCGAVRNVTGPAKTTVATGAPATPAIPAAPVTFEAPVMKAPKKKKGKLIAIIAAIAVALGAIGAVIYFIVNNDGDGTGVSINGKKDNKEEEKVEEPTTYVGEIEAYLDYIADKSTKIDGFLSNAYMGGGAFYGGSQAKEIHEIIYKQVFEFLQDASMDYSSYYSDISDYDDWKEYLRECAIKPMYEEFDDRYGDDWKLKYKIEDEEKLSEDDLEDLSDYWEDIVAVYESSCEYYDFSRSDKKKMESFVEYLEDLEPDEAYEVDVRVQIEGEDFESDLDYSFIVAKYDGEWIIVDGPTAYDLATAH